AFNPFPAVMGMIDGERTRREGGGAARKFRPGGTQGGRCITGVGTQDPAHIGMGRRVVVDHENAMVPRGGLGREAVHYEGVPVTRRSQGLHLSTGWKGGLAGF